jgi:ElaB/YqjD/DUF883 family membrane-anchored ribosome-binding protein
MSDAIQKASANLDTLLADVIETLKKAQAQASDQAHDAHESLSQAVVALADHAKTIVSDSKATATSLAKTAADEARAHPVATAATLAAAAAAIAGLIAVSRSHKPG